MTLSAVSLFGCQTERLPPYPAPRTPYEQPALAIGPDLSRLDWTTRAQAYDAQGLWLRLYGLGGSDRFLRVAPFADGRLVAVGYADVRGASAARHRDALVCSFARDGGLLWEKTFGFSGRADVAMDVAGTPRGTLLVSGRSWFYGAHESRVFLAELAPEGRLLRKRLLDIPDLRTSERIETVALGGGLYLLDTMVFRDGGSRWDKKSRIYALDDGWQIAWISEILLGESNTTRSLRRRESRSFVAAGTTEVDGETRGFLSAHDDRGEAMLQRTYRLGTYTWFSDVEPCDDGGFVVAGCVSMAPGPSSGKTDALVLRVDARGETLWHRVFGERRRSNHAACIVGLPGGRFGVAGSTGLPGRAFGQTFLVVLDGGGSIELASALGGEGNRDVKDMCSVDSTTVVLCGDQDFPGTHGQAFVASVGFSFDPVPGQPGEGVAPD